MAEYSIVASREEHKYFPYSGLFYVKRNTFYAAGQDSFTLAPAQNPDMFMSLQNIETLGQGILQRRRGYTLFSNTTGAGPFELAYSFRSESLLIRNLVFTNSTNVEVINEDGSFFIASLFSPSPDATFNPRMVVSRDFGYFSDGSASDLFKWDGTDTPGLNLTNWGIDVNQITGGGGGGVVPGTVGPNSPANGVDLGDNVAPWTVPTNIEIYNDNNLATSSIPSNTLRTNTIQANSFNFAVPASASISSIVVQAKASFTTTSTSGVPGTLFAQLVINGNPVGSTYSVPLQKAAVTTSLTFPSSALWNVPGGISASQLNSSTFGVNLYGQEGFHKNMIIQIDGVQVTVNIQVPIGAGLTPVPVASGNITLLSQTGRVYFYAFHNSKTGHTSDLSPASIGSGPVTLENIQVNNIPTSTDPQVDTVLLLATADGGDETTLYLVASLANGTSTFLDTIPDGIFPGYSGPTLFTQNIYQDTDENGLLHGVANNKRPPAINFPVKHKGRIYGSIGQALYFSKNLDDVTTSTGLITGKWEEAWPAIYTMDISEQAETIQGLLSDGETLWIGTERSVRRLIGDSPSNFQKPEIQFNETGILNQESWKIVFYEGQPIGSMWLTPDFRVIGSDFNTYDDVGHPIQDVLNSINSAAVSAIHASFVSKGPADYYMLYLPTGTNTTPDTVCVYDLRSQLWFIWQPLDSPTASLFFINASGTPTWLFASVGNAGFHQIYAWDDTVVRQDRNGNTPVPFICTAQTSWLDFGDSSIRKVLNQIVILANDPSITFQVEGATRQVDFTTPVSVLPPSAITAGPFGDLFVGLAGRDSDQRFYRFTFSDSAAIQSTTQTFLGGYELEVAPIHRF